jgi:hypothetical protein
MQASCIFNVTTNVNNASSSHKNLFHYIYAAGGQFIWQRHSWLFVAFPGISFSPTSKNNHMPPTKRCVLNEQRTTPFCLNACSAVVDRLFKTAKAHSHA